MHVLTKAFVVLAAILSVALSALVVAYAVNTDRINAAYIAMTAERDSTRALAAAQTSLNSTERINMVATIDSLNAKNAELEATRRRLEAESATLRAEKNKAESSRQSIEGKIAELGETVKTQTNIIQNYRDEVTTLRKNELDYRGRALDYENLIADLTSQREVLEQNYRALQEQLTELKRTQDLAMSGASAGSADQPYEFRGTPINGRIDSVQKDPAGGNLIAKINVGTNDRVAKNMKFAIVRDNQFIANLVVKQPDLMWSIGEVTLINTGKEVRAGDLVISSLK